MSNSIEFPPDHQGVPSSRSREEYERWLNEKSQEMTQILFRPRDQSAGKTRATMHRLSEALAAIDRRILFIDPQSDTARNLAQLFNDGQGDTTT